MTTATITPPAPDIEATQAALFALFVSLPPPTSKAALHAFAELTAARARLAPTLPAAELQRLQAVTQASVRLHTALAKAASPEPAPK